PVLRTGHAAAHSPGLEFPVARIFGHDRLHFPKKAGIEGADPPKVKAAPLEGDLRGDLARLSPIAQCPRPMTVDGILPCQAIEALIANDCVSATSPFEADQVQPASLDLRLGERAWRVRASFLPGPTRKV